MHYFSTTKNLFVRRRHLRGFTLIEFLLASTIAGILISLAVPSFYPLLQSYRIFDTAVQLERGIRQARQEAIMRNRVVRMCPSTDGQYCAAENNWSPGYITFVDSSEDASRQDAEELISIQIAQKQVAVHFNRNQHIRFNGLGRANTNGTFTICDLAGKTASRQLVLIHSGRIRKTVGDGRCS